MYNIQLKKHTFGHDNVSVDFVGIVWLDLYGNRNKIHSTQDYSATFTDSLHTVKSIVVTKLVASSFPQ